MANYTANQLNGSGIFFESFSGFKNIFITVPNVLKGSSYLTFETIRDNNGFYNSSIPLNAIGDKGGTSNISILEYSPYIFSVILKDVGLTEQEKLQLAALGIPSTVTHSVNFTPSTPILANTLKIRGTGGISCFTP